MKYLISFIIFFAFYLQPTFAQTHDTIKVQTFTYGSPQDAWFVFPSDTVRIEKILMHYKLKCNPAQNPACGEWDYLTYNYLYEHTGKFDSTLQQQPNFTVDDNSMDSVMFNFTPSWIYNPVFEKHIIYDDTISFDSTVVGNGIIVSDIPFNSKYPVCRSQFLWKKTELISIGMANDTITGIRFYFLNSGSTLKDLKIRIKNFQPDSLNPPVFEPTGFDTVYSGTTSVSSPGWRSFKFIKPFVWDSAKCILMDISFDNDSSGISSAVKSGNTGWISSVRTSEKNYCLHFEGKDYVAVPNYIFNQVDSFITIAFWAYGNPKYLPENCSIFNGADSAGNRVLNAHLPWSNESVYWDAGNSKSSSYDRINSSATTEYKGKWNHWAFTKNAKTGTMNVFLNGNLWLTGTGKTKTMTGIKVFKIGSASDGTSNYDGDIDEFTIWKKDLGSSSIKSFMTKGVNSSNPDYSDLLLYYKFDDVQNIHKATDSSISHCTGTLVGLPQYFKRQSGDFNMNIVPDSLRPNVVFERGSYISHIDSVLRIDSIIDCPFQAVLFKDTIHPTNATDTITAWHPYYHFSFDSLGHHIDSVLVGPDSIIFRSYRPYYKLNPIVNRYELGRYITPYGNGLSLGNGFEWIYDVSDYRTLLHDSVHLTAGNWQELLDMRFDLIKGIPPRDPIRVKNLWVGNPGYGTSNSIENFLTPKRIKIDNDAMSTRFKLRTTGHGMGGTDNCGEFCPKVHSLKIDSVTRYSILLWKDDCALNPLYPQGGTWVYQRSNWCPGAVVPTFDFELSPYVSHGDSVTLDYDVQPYTWNGSGSAPNYVIETQLVSYGSPNFPNDAAIEAIKSPSRKDIYKRMNPVCGKPRITIRNTGANPLTSLRIQYGIIGEHQSVYHWTGFLKFLDTTDVVLGSFVFRDTGTFAVSISNPNGLPDQYANNNYMTSDFIPPPVYPNDIIITLSSNKQALQNAYILRNCNGDTILYRDHLANQTTYRDTLHLQDGCYELVLVDRIDSTGNGEDGLYFWNNTAQGSGSFSIKRRYGSPTVLKNFPPDFGAQIFHQFSVGNYMNEKSLNYSENLKIYPNPSNSDINIETGIITSKVIEVSLFNLVGTKVYEKSFHNASQNRIKINISTLPSGMYLLRLSSDDETVTRKIIKY